MRGVYRVVATLLLASSVVVVTASRAPAFEAWDGRLALHGFAEMQLRGLADDYDIDRAYFAQWAQVLNLELELEVAPDGWGPFDVVSAFARIEARYECIYTGCGAASTHRQFGDRAKHAPGRNWTNAGSTNFSGDVFTGQGVDVHRDTELLPVSENPILAPLKRFIAASSVDPDPLAATLAPLEDYRFTFKHLDGSVDRLAFQMGPWSPRHRIVPNGALASIANPTRGLPLRPSIPAPDTPTIGARGLYVPSGALLERISGFDDFDQNFSESELAWNHGAGQDEHELKELYVDLDLFDGRLWMRLGKQNIVWGKTELFRTTDQFNPQDLALSSLPGLEESRLAQWSARAVWSFYDLGPLQDVRLEVGANLDDFEPVDLGRCGEPYTIWITCAKGSALFGHGVLGFGVAGEQRPDPPWDDVRGVEVGVRVEWRWDRFSFSLVDFWGYSDAPVVERFNAYERAVDAFSGRPLDRFGRPFPLGLGVDETLARHASNRQIFDLFCSVTVGIAAVISPEPCLVDVLNDTDTVVALGLTPAEAIGQVLGGTAIGDQIAALIAMLPPSDYMVELNVDPNDGPGGGGIPGFVPSSLSARLTDEQEALLGCGLFFGTNCDGVDPGTGLRLGGVDLFNAEASALVQSLPLIDPDAPVATRFVDGQLVILPGARGPGDVGYDPLVDGTPPPGFASEMAALSQNVGVFLGLLEIGIGASPDCSLAVLEDCDAVRALVGVTGVRRPEMRAGGNGRHGRRDFLWQGGGEALLRYPKRNLLGLSADFAEDWSKTNWSVEFSWADDTVFADSLNASGIQEADQFNLTVSVDRPTFVNFLNAHRTFFVNSQFFFGYVPDHDSSFDIDGSMSVLGTLTVATGYFQDRLLPAMTFVHDLHSASGALISQVAYRFDQDFSATFGLALFYGKPQRLRVPEAAILFTNQGNDYSHKRGFGGLSPIAERDEVSLRLRYTF